ncbi:piggyBac transposable element-derived protein 4 [Nephila pilipes]|uniref:PiggyBac transposable element-derived protein 4 n=1 Tax=Nephila pilipes TaxID=299642 RepID=A0A8X6U3J3_NEPPI|nr:piggyBac transposable element-derived protein 4 [Nephila pilipes]
MLDDLTQVRNFCEIDSSNPPLGPPHFSFNANPALYLNIDIRDGTQQFLDIFLDDNLIEMIVAETNQYTDQFIRNSNLQRYSRTRKRKPKTKNEIQAFILLNILQGNVKRPDVEHFWKAYDHFIREDICLPKTSLPATMHYLILQFRSHYRKGSVYE